MVTCFLCWLPREGCSAREGQGCQAACCQVWGGEGQAWSNAARAPRHEQSFNQCYSKEVVGVRGPPLILFYRGEKRTPV